MPLYGLILFFIVGQTLRLSNKEILIKIGQFNRTQEFFFVEKYKENVEN